MRATLLLRLRTLMSFMIPRFLWASRRGFSLSRAGTNMRLHIGEALVFSAIACLRILTYLKMRHLLWRKGWVISRTIDIVLCCCMVMKVVWSREHVKLITVAVMFLRRPEPAMIFLDSPLISIMNFFIYGILKSLSL